MVQCSFPYAEAFSTHYNVKALMFGQWCKPLPYTVAVEHSDLCEHYLHPHFEMLVNDKVADRVCRLS